jgi:drug/metabolite transporter (DMT)-like permease
MSLRRMAHGAGSRWQALPLVAVLLGLLVAVSYGAGDFFGGLASRRLPTPVVVAVSQLVGLALLVAVVATTGGHQAIGADVRAGAVGGSVGLVGLLLLYRGLAVGSMSVIAPITAVGAAVLPLAYGLIDGERPGLPALAGVVLALVAVTLVAAPAEETAAGTRPLASHSREVALALGAGTAFGVVFILFGTTSEASGLWPVLAARLASVSLVTVGTLVVGHRLTVPRGTRALVVGAGILDVTANGLYVVAARTGLLSLVSVLASLYPAATVVLARVVLREVVTARQRAGLALALAGVALIATG